MLPLEGISISPGYASGIAIVYDYEIERRLDVPRRDLSSGEIATEHDRLDQAVERSRGELQKGRRHQHFSSELFEIDALLAAHAQMVNEVAEIVRLRVSEDFVNVEHALDVVIDEFVQRINQLESEYFREREQDLRDVGRRMMRHLTGLLPLSAVDVPANSVIVAPELLPSETVELAQSGLAAMVIERGGRYSHTAILARTLQIPAVAGIPDITTRIRSGERVLVDGETGTIIVAPSSTEMEHFAAQKKKYEQSLATAAAAAPTPCVTRDGVDVALLANVGRPEEMNRIHAHQLEGVGLFRTEFMYLESLQRPSYEHQVDIYLHAATCVGDAPLVIRTFDFGGDKVPPFLSAELHASETFSHLRGLRFSLAEERLLETQLRAVVRVAQEKNIRVLIPMVIGSHDLSQAIAVIDRLIRESSARRRPLIGAMIETPAALFALDEILELVDFVSIGTNDLTQYMLASDRDSATSPDEYTALHPAMLRAIKEVVDAAAVRGRPVCVCGEEAGDVDYACLLVGLGVRELSLSPGRAAAVRQAVREIDARRARDVAVQALGCRRPCDVRELLPQMRFSGATAEMHLDSAPTGAPWIGR